MNGDCRITRIGIAIYHDELVAAEQPNRYAYLRLRGAGAPIRVKDDGVCPPGVDLRVEDIEFLGDITAHENIPLKAFIYQWEVPNVAR